MASLITPLDWLARYFMDATDLLPFEGCIFYYSQNGIIISKIYIKNGKIKVMARER